MSAHLSLSCLTSPPPDTTLQTIILGSSWYSQCKGCRCSASIEQKPCTLLITLLPYPLHVLQPCRAILMSALFHFGMLLSFLRTIALEGPFFQAILSLQVFVFFVSFLALSLCRFLFFTIYFLSPPFGIPYQCATFQLVIESPTSRFSLKIDR